MSSRQSRRLTRSTMSEAVGTLWRQMPPRLEATSVSPFSSGSNLSHVRHLHHAVKWSGASRNTPRLAAHTLQSWLRRQQRATCGRRPPSGALTIDSSSLLDTRYVTVTSSVTGKNRRETMHRFVLPYCMETPSSSDSMRLSTLCQLQVEGEGRIGRVSVMFHVSDVQHGEQTSQMH